MLRHGDSQEISFFISRFAYLLDLIEDENIKNVQELKEKSESIEFKRIEPEEWWNLGTEFDAEIIITWSKLKACYDLIFKPKNIEGKTHLQTQKTKPPFFCLPEILGNVFELEPLARYLGSEQPFYGLRSLGLDEDIQPHTNMADIAAHHIKAIQEIQPNGPYFLGVHSFGGKVAFEINLILWYENTR